MSELSLGSERFRTLWARHDVRTGSPHVSRWQHPQVGELVLDLEKLVIQGTDRQVLVLLHADLASPSGERLALLASLAAPSGPDSGSRADSSTSSREALENI